MILILKLERLLTEACDLAFSLVYCAKLFGARTQLQSSEVSRLGVRFRIGK